MLYTELGDNKHGRVDRKADIACHESVRGQLCGKSIRRHQTVGVPDRGRQRAQGNVFLRYTTDGGGQVNFVVSK